MTMRRLPFRRSDARREVDDELAFHLAMRERDLAADGVAPEAARERAAREFGDVGAVRDACLTIDARRTRRAHRAEHMSGLWQDLRFAARALRAAPAFAVAAMLCVALGVGATTTIFSVVDAVLLRPLPYRDADRLVAVYAQNPSHDYHRVNISLPDAIDWRDGSRTLSALGAWTWTSHALQGGVGDAERVDGAAVAPELFPLLGVRPALGRPFARDENVEGRGRVVLLSDALWNRRYGGDRAIVGRAITVDAKPYTVIGVMPPGFAFPERGALWVPLVPERWMTARSNRGLAGAIARMKPGVTMTQVKTDLAALSVRLAHEYPNDNTGWAAEVIPLREDLVGDLRKPVLVFLGAAAIVLLIACANVANLLLARGAARQRELALRAAIGAGRGRLVRQVLTESVLVALVGGVLGVALAMVGVRLLGRALPDGVPFYVAFGVDGSVLAFAIVLSLLTGLAFGAAPAARTSRVGVAGTLRQGARGSDGPGRSRLRNALVIAEVALSLVLMVGAGLLLRSYRALLHTDLGFAERGALTVRVSLPGATYESSARRIAFHEALIARVRALPGVTVVGSAQGLPFSGWDVQSYAVIDGEPPARPGEERDARYQFVSPGFLDALGVSIARGRGLRETDADTVPRVTVVSETFAHRFFPSGDALGRRVRVGMDSGWATIVGIAHDYRHERLPKPTTPVAYFPLAAGAPYSQTLVIRTPLVDPLALAPAVRAAVRALDPAVPAYEVQTLSQQVARSLWRPRLQGMVLGVFAGIALALSVLGIYGVISYVVAQRTRELGVRLALGATRGQLLALVLRQGGRLAALGLAIGLAASFASARVLSGLLYGVAALDPLTFAAVPLALGAAALLATLAPARRATRVDPIVAIRNE